MCVGVCVCVCKQFQLVNTNFATRRAAHHIVSKIFHFIYFSAIR